MTAPAERRASPPAAGAAPAAARPDPRLRLLVALAIGALAAAFTLYKYHALREWRTTDASGPASDFDQVRYAALALWRGQDPYAVIGPGRAFDWHWPFFYPLTAAVATMPFAALSALAARCLFVGASTAALAYGLTRHAWHRLFVLLSPWGFYAIHLGQWTPAFTAALALAPGVGAGVALGVLMMIKPTIGAAVLTGVPLGAGRRSPGVVTLAAAGVAAAALLAASLLAQPGWISAWLGSLHQQQHFKPLVAIPGGVLVLLALLRWRRPEARLLAALACVPQTFWWYDVLPLALVARSRLESLVLAMLGWVAYAVYNVAFPRAASPEIAFANVARLTVACAYLPCLLMVLRRPNEGAVPEWAERAATTLRESVRRLRRGGASSAPDEPHPSADRT